MFVHEEDCIFFGSTRVHETLGKIDPVTDVDTAASPHPPFIAFLPPFSFVTVTFAEISHTARFGDGVHHSGRNDRLCIGCLSRSSCEEEKWNLQSIL